MDHILEKKNTAAAGPECDAFLFFSKELWQRKRIYESMVKLQEKINLQEKKIGEFHAILLCLNCILGLTAIKSVNLLKIVFLSLFV
jgi:hypothetical protein